MRTDGTVACWGYNAYGQLGDGTTDQHTPWPVSGLSNAVAIAAGGYHTCAVTRADGLKCWGYNGYGQLGDGTQTDRWTPVDVAGMSPPVGGIAELPPLASAPGGSGMGGTTYAVLAGAAAGVLAFAVLATLSVKRRGVR